MLASIVLSCILCIIRAEVLPEKVKFDATLSAEDNWGVPTGGEKPKAKANYYDINIRAKCAAQWKGNEMPMSDLLKTATAIHSKDTSLYDEFKSTDLVPENKEMYGKMSPWGKEGKYSYNSVMKKSMKASTCNIDQDDSKWEVTRIGPFFTRGGYDWLQIGWDDIWGFKEILKTHSDGVYIIEQYMSPVLVDGTRLNNPPIHIHHIHVGPDASGTYVRQRTDPFVCAFKNESCFNPIRTMEIHGDYVCPEEEGGNDCHVENYGPGRGKLITESIGVEGEINDVRAIGSEELEWYWEMGARWVPRTFTVDPATNKKIPSMTSMSLLNLGGPGTYDPKVQKSYLFTFPTPTDHESVFWYTGRLKFGGSLLRMKIHAHNSFFQESLFIAASPEQLGMTERNGFSQSTPHLTVNPSEVGFEDAATLKRFLLANLEKSQKTFDSTQSKAVAPTNCGFPHAPCKETRPQVVCQVFGRVEVIDGFAFDRRSLTSCDPWRWPSGQVFTVIGFSKHRGFPLGPHLPHAKIPAELAGHVGYWLSYDSEEEPQQSHWSYSMYSHDPDGEQENVLDMSGYQKIAILLNGHTSPHYNDWTKTPHSVISMIIYSALTHAFITLIVTAVVVVLAAKQLYKLTVSALHDVPHKKSDDIFCPSNSQEPAAFFFNHLNKVGLGGKSGGDVELKRRGKAEGGEDEEKTSLLADQDEANV